MGYSTTAKLSNEDLLEIFRLHKLGVSMRQLGRQFGVSHKSISWRLKKNSVEQGSIISVNRSIPGTKLLGTGKFDWKAFQKTPEEERAYWAGFIIADGNISKNTLTIELSDKDREHLSWWNRFNVSIYHNNRRSSTALSATNPYLISWLNNWNVQERKTGTEIFPKHQSDSLLVHWIRGFIDGDGWFSNATGSLMGGMCSASHGLLESIQQFLLQYNVESKLKTFHVLNKLPHYKLIIYQRMSFRLMDLVNGSPRLNRKWEQVIKARRNAKGMSDAVIKRVEELRRQGLALRAIAKETGYSFSAVKYRLAKEGHHRL